MLSAERLASVAEANWFRSLHFPLLVVDADLRIRAVNRAYGQATGHAPSDLVDEPMFDAFPDNPADPTADGVAKLSASFERVLRYGQRHAMGVQHYDVPDPSKPGEFVHKVWVPVNSPIRENGRAVAVLHHVEDVTDVVAREAVARSDIPSTARRLSAAFPSLAPEMVLGVVATSHRAIVEALGVPDARQAESLARLRLDLLAVEPPGTA